MVKVVLQCYPVIPAADEAEREALRPLGRNRDRYQEVLSGWNDIIKAADDLGLWGVATIEHHFHSEGYEVGPNPGILNAYWAANTKNVRVGAMGYVMSAQDPIRVAEETAILDHLTKGRSFVGFARGYQSRWTNVIGQHLGSRATISPSAAAQDAAHIFGSKRTAEELSDDEVNRRVFEEALDIVYEAWTKDSIAINGKTWKIPYPQDTGVDNWPLAKVGVTQRFGAPGEADADGNIRRVSVVPAPYTNPHPPVFVATSGSPESAESAARRGYIPLYFTGIKTCLKLGRVYAETAAAHGRPMPFGKNQCMVRSPHIGATTAAAEEALLRCDGDIYKNFYAAMGGKKIETKDIVPAAKASGIWVAGTIDEVKRQFVEDWKQMPTEYVTLIMHYAQMPKEEVIHNLTMFMKHIKPALDELTDY